MDNSYYLCPLENKWDEKELPLTLHTRNVVLGSEIPRNKLLQLALRSSLLEEIHLLPSVHPTSIALGTSVSDSRQSRSICWWFWPMPRGGNSTLSKKEQVFSIEFCSSREQSRKALVKVSSKRLPIQPCSRHFILQNTERLKSCFVHAGTANLEN